MREASARPVRYDAASARRAKRITAAKLVCASKRNDSLRDFPGAGRRRQRCAVVVSKENSASALSELPPAGTLSEEEFAAFDGGGLTATFVSRLFEEHIVGRCTRDEMDFDAFLDFVLSWTSRQHPVSMAYLFRALSGGCPSLRDTEARHQANCAHGITLMKARCCHVQVRHLFEEVHAKWVVAGYDGLRVQDLVDEVFDMTNTTRAEGISLRDLTRSGTGSTVLAILASASEFAAFDSVESALSAAAEADALAQAGAASEHETEMPNAAGL